jgi:outer membrane lipoprotein carrier protein
MISVTVLAENNELKKEDVIPSIRDYYSKTTSFQSDFKQNFYHKAYKKNRTSNGKVAFKRDLKMKWSYINPERKYIISNGKTIWIYEPENEQVFKSSVKNSEMEKAAQFIFGKEGLFDDYNIKAFKKSSKYGKIEVHLTPKAKQSSYKLVILYFSENFTLKTTQAIDNFDNINTIEYIDSKKNNVIKDDFF